MLDASFLKKISSPFQKVEKLYKIVLSSTHQQIVNEGFSESIDVIFYCNLNQIDDIIKTTTLHFWYGEWWLSPVLLVFILAIMILGLLSYLKEFTSVSTVTEDLLLQTYSLTSFLLLFTSILVTGAGSILNSNEYENLIHQGKHTWVILYFAIETRMINFQKTCWQHIATFTEHIQFLTKVLSVILKVNM